MAAGVEHEVDDGEHPRAQEVVEEMHLDVAVLLIE
jgi:hypothetical protein